MFAELFRLRRNWLNGYCNVRIFEGHTQGGCVCLSICLSVCLSAGLLFSSSLYAGISCVQFDDTRIVSGSWDKTIKVCIQDQTHTHLIH